MLILTQSSTFLIGWIAKILGFIMNGIFNVIDFIGIPNIGLAIIIFTIVVNVLLMPLTIKQQKFSKLSAKLNPELKAIQAKYKGKKDNESMMAQNQETQALYAKYGVSASGSCIQLLIQLPILWALYGVIRNVPAYVTKVKDAFFPLVDELIDTVGASDFIQTFKNSAMYASQFNNANFVPGSHSDYVKNTFIDSLNMASSSEFLSIADKFPNLKDQVDSSFQTIRHFNQFLGLNIGDSPQYIFMQGWQTGAWLVMIGALIIPMLSGLTQWINVKLMPQQAVATNDDKASSMASSMKMMNNFMPLMSMFFCFSLPSGMGLYWTAGSVIRGIQQVLINRHLDKINFDELIKKNTVKSKKKLEKIEKQKERMNQYASMNTKSIQSKANSVTPTGGQSTKISDIYRNVASENEKKRAESIKKSGTTGGSLRDKANMVKQYNEKGNASKKDS
jgi:YidC/Oxa1 family membrane protein insertase